MKRRSTNLVNLEDVEYGIASANSVKNAGQTIWAVGVANPGGTGITSTNLELVSGPGDFFTADLDDLQETLRILANQLCGSRIHVRKLIGGRAAAWLGVHRRGWRRGCDVREQPCHHRRQLVRTSSASTTSPRAGPRQPVTVTESLAGHAGFSLAAAACQLNSYPAAGTGTPTNPQSIAQIQRNQDWYCTFNNAVQGSVTVVKDRVPNGPTNFAFTATNSTTPALPPTPAAFSLDDDADAALSNTQVLTGLADGQTYVVTETTANQAGFTLTGLVCTGGGADTTVNPATGVATIGFDAGENDRVHLHQHPAGFGHGHQGHGAERAGELRVHRHQRGDSRRPSRSMMMPIRRCRTRSC